MPAGTLLVVGGWVLSPIIKEVIGEVRSLVSSKYTSFKDFAEHLDELVDVLDQIRRTVESVQQGRRTDNVSGGMDSRVRPLVDFIHEVDSVMIDFANDDIHKFNLRDRKVAQVGHSAARAGRRLIGIDKPFNQLKKLLEKLPTIRQKLRDLVPQLQIQAGSSRSLSVPATGPLLPVATVGYEHEYDRLVSALLNNVSSNSKSSNNVVAVIGHSGIGKTTMARRAWHDDRRINVEKKHFDLMVWASVPYMLNKTALLTEIWRSIPGSSRRVDAAEMSFGMLQQEVKELVGSRRYLLVLDDVCNDESGLDPRETMKTTWDDVLAPFMHGGQGQGSRILVTSRAKNCVKTLGAGTSIVLEGVGDPDLFRLLKKTAFGDEREETPRLDDVIMSVARQLKSSPSAAKAFGEKMRNNYRKKDWKKQKVDCGGAGKITLGDVPLHLQSCLGFCSLFPDKWEFEPGTLVKMWIAQGMVGGGSQSMEDVGRDYVRELHAFGMLKSISKAGSRTPRFVIHEQIHSTLMSVNAPYFLRLGSDDLNRDRLYRIPATVRHLSLTGGGCLALAQAQLKDDTALKKLRTLLVFDDGSSSSDTSAVVKLHNHVLKQLKAVLVLDFASTRITELPKAVGELKRLRYLGLPYSLRRLPAQVSKLLHLQTLSLGKDCKLDEFPGDGMSSLINLRHLDMDMKYIAMIRGIGRLRHLQGSVEFCADKGKGHGMEELASMDSLSRTLTVKGLDAVADKKEAQRAELKRKESLKVLKLEWGLPKLGTRACSTSSQDDSSQEQVLDGLQPHPKIEELHITRYQGKSSPSWLESGNLQLRSLSHLHLINCRNWLTLPCLSGLPDLRVLHIKGMYSVTRIDHSLYHDGGLRCLEKLVVDDMPKLEEWSAESADNAFPCLREISILNCPNLVKLPRPVPSTVRNMRIEKDESYYLDMSFAPKSDSYTLDVQGDAVRLLHQDLLHQDQAMAISSLSIKKYAGENEVNVHRLSSVRSLSLSRCGVPDRQLGVFFQNLKSLERLQISDCSEFRAFPESAMPASLKSIELKGCHPALVENVRGSARTFSITRVHND